jgi:hypothetical protein
MYFNIRNTLPKSGPFLLLHPVYMCGFVCVYIYIYIYVYINIYAITIKCMKAQLRVIHRPLVLL